MPIVLAALWLLGAAGEVTVNAGAPTTLVLTPAARVLIPGGTFVMGAGTDDVRAARSLCADELRSGGALMLELSPRCSTRFDAESPTAEVVLPAFSIDRVEVTVAAYARCVREGACRPPVGPSAGDDDDLPIEKVTWNEAAAHCRWKGGRLPTEAEWEKAARGALRRTWPWGNEWHERRANHGRAERSSQPAGATAPADDTLDPVDGHAGPSPAGAFPTGASPYGVLDMAGNVWEWTATHFAREPPQAATRFDPRGPTNATERTIRGGSYRSAPSDLRTTRRVGLHPGERAAGVGFRCAYTVAAPAP